MLYFIGNGNDFGMLQQLALYAMYKRAALGDWAQYSQLAGTNFRVVKYRGDVPDPARRLAVRTIVNNAGQGTLDLPDGIDVETSNQTSSSQNQLFENYVQYLDDNMTKLVLGQTMTTEDGSSRSQAEVHERVQDTIFDSDGKYILTLLNYDLAGNG
jgi:phage gp29-like protein